MGPEREELRVSQVRAGIEDLLARWGVPSRRTETTVVSSAPPPDGFSLVPRHVVQALRVARAVNAGGFQANRLDILGTITELARDPRTETIGRGLLDLIEWDESTRPRIPYGLDALARKAAEMDVDGWRQTLRAAVTNVIRGSNKESERILRKIVSAAFGDKYLEFVEGLFDKNAVGAYSVFPEASTKEVENLRGRLSDLRYRSLVVLLDQGHTDLVRRLLRVIETWQVRPHGIVDVLIHTAALVSPGDAIRMATISDMMDLVEEQARLPRYFESRIVGRQLGRRMLRQSFLDISVAMPETGSHQLRTVGRGDDDLRSARAENGQLIDDFRELLKRLLRQLVSAPGGRSGNNGRPSVPPGASTPPATPETPPPLSAASRFANTGVMAAPAHTWMMAGLGHHGFAGSDVSLSPNRTMFVPPPAVSMTTGAAWMTASRAPVLNPISSPAVMRFPGAQRTPVMQFTA